jgi:lysophospholipase L1-like esterase
MALRYVAIGDSTVEGLMDPGHDGVYVGWADRLAQHLKAVHPELLYANLAVRGKLAAEVRAEQLPSAVAMQPDIAVAVAGVNDVLRPRFDAARLREDLHAIHRALASTGARVDTFTMPDMGSVAPLAAALRPRFAALNAVTRDLGARFGTVVVDLDREPVASHPALWDDDRLHGNSEGHRRIALALAEALDLPLGVPADQDWRAPLPDVPRHLPRVVAGELRWVAGHLLPWALRHARGHSSGEVVTCKRPELLPV